MVSILKMGITCAKAPYQKARSRKKTFSITHENQENQSPYGTPVATTCSLPGGYLHQDSALKTICQSDPLINGALNNNDTNTCNGGTSMTHNGSTRPTSYTDCHPEATQDTQPTMSSVKMWFLKRGTTFKRKLGHGAYATVVLAHSKPNKGLVAVKVIDLIGQKRKHSESRKLALEREVDVMCSLRHDNLIQVLQRPVKLYGRYLCLVMELAHQDLFDLLQTQGALSEAHCRRLFSQLMAALSYCHGRGVAHRDLKCENILLTEDGDVKLSDFGMARKCYNEEEDRPEMCKTYCGSSTYMAPEVLKRRPYDAFKADMWSTGVVLYAILTASMPFDDHVTQRLITQQMERDWQLPDKMETTISTECRGLLNCLLEPSIDVRPSVRQVLTHAWLL